jgi:activator of HSP90 ATPase
VAAGMAKSISIDANARRRFLVGGAALLGALAARSAFAQNKAKNTMPELPATAPEDMARTSLHQEVDFAAAPQQLYEALLDSKKFTAFSGDTAKIDRQVGGAFAMFGGRITGRNVELVASRRIVQAWRPASWEPGVYSIVKFEITGYGDHAKITLDHTGFAEGDFGHLNAGWESHYWVPLKKYLA